MSGPVTGPVTVRVVEPDASRRRRLPARGALRALGPRRLVLLGVVLALALGGLALWRHDDRTTITAYFSGTTGLYVGDQVRVLGVHVGDVTAVEPEGGRVRVELAVESDRPIPADAKAAIVAPSLVSGRFVQLAPAYDGGPRMADGAVLDTDRTAVPVSFDEVKRELTDLATALGPDGPVGRSGALAQAIGAVDANLGRGGAARLRTSLSTLRSAAATISEGRGDLFATIRNLDVFTRTLLRYDVSVRGFTTNLRSASDVLAQNRTRLTTVVRELERALRSVGALARRHDVRLTRGVRDAADLSATLADKADVLGQILHLGPHAVADLFLAVDNHALTGRLALGNIDSTASLLCGLVLGVGGSEAQCRQALGPLLDALGVSAVPGSAAATQLGSGKGRAR